jgi:hypothetical protein
VATTGANTNSPRSIRGACDFLEDTLLPDRGGGRAVPSSLFYDDEVAEAEAQGLPYVLVPRELSREEWIEQYSPKTPDGLNE